MGSKARSTPASFLHENNRADGKVKRRTAAKLSDWPVERIETLRALRRGDKLVRGAGRGIVQRDGSGAQWCIAPAFAGWPDRWLARPRRSALRDRHAAGCPARAEALAWSDEDLSAAVSCQCPA
jgi:hypothetical protein